MYTYSEEGAEMPRGDKSTYTDKQKRQAEHIEEGYEKRGVPHVQGGMVDSREFCPAAAL
jgi:hypothetical protein